MADWIPQLITDNLVTTVSGVTTANGYNTNIAACEQERIIMKTNDVFPRVEIAGPAISFARAEEGVNPSGRVKATLEYSAFYYEKVNDENAADDPATKQTTNAPADIIKALMVDRRRGEYAIMTTITDAYPSIDFMGNIPLFLWVITFEVETFMNESNPYSN